MITETVHSRKNAGYIGRHNSIAIDSSNKVHISFHDTEDLEYATKTCGFWYTEIAAPRCRAVYTSIAVDSRGVAHIGFQKNDGNTDEPHNLGYSVNLSGQWMRTTVDFAGSVGEVSSMAIDLNNKAHISYFDHTNDAFKYATNSTGAWTSEMLDNGIGAIPYVYFAQDTSLAVDSKNKVHISYFSYTESALKYATNTSGSWIITTLDAGSGCKYGGICAGRHNSIAIDSEDKVHISYQKGNISNYSLHYATNVSGQWVIETVDDPNVVNATSIAIDSLDRAHIGYQRFYEMHAVKISGSWIKEKVDIAGGYGDDSSIAIDSSDSVHISYMTKYYGNTRSSLKYATNVSGSWVTRTLQGNISARHRGTSLAVDSSDKVHISYYDDSVYNLKYATNVSGSWEINEVDRYGWNTADPGAYSSLALDSSDRVHISYFDGGSYDLKYAVNVGGSSDIRYLPGFSDDFSDGKLAGDPDWEEVSGNWSVNPYHRFFSAMKRNNRAVVRGIDALDTFSIGRLETYLKLTKKFMTTANGAVIFAYKNNSNYRYILVKKGIISKVAIGQVGDPAGVGESGAIKVSKGRLLKFGHWYRIVVDILPGGMVNVYFNNARAPFLWHDFVNVAPGRVGLQAVRSRVLFDDFAAWDYSSSLTGRRNYGRSRIGK